MAKKDPNNFLRFVIVPQTVRAATGPNVAVTVRLGSAFVGPVVFTIKVFRFCGVGNEKDKPVPNHYVSIPGGDFSMSRTGTGVNTERTQQFMVPLDRSTQHPVAIKYVVSCNYNSRDYVQQSGQVVVLPV